MRVTVNGEAQDFPPGETITAALLRLGVDPRAAAVERNREIVPKSMHGRTVIEEGDSLEIVHFVGGG